VISIFPSIFSSFGLLKIFIFTARKKLYLQLRHSHGPPQLPFHFIIQTSDSIHIPSS